MGIPGKEPVVAGVIEIIAHQLDIKADKIRLNMKIQDDLGADSLDAINIALALEDKYGFQIEDEALQDFKKIDDIIDEVKRVLEL